MAKQQHESRRQAGSMAGVSHNGNICGKQEILYNENNSHLKLLSVCSPSISGGSVQPAEPTLQQEVCGLYRDHHHWLTGWLRHKLGNAFDAADLAQDVFVRLLTRQEPVAAREPKAFLSTIARRLVVDHWRRRELEQAWLETLAAWPETEVPSPESRAIFLEALVAIDAVLDALKPAVRTAFLLAQLDGFTCPRIAQELGVSLSTAERYIAKALRACYAQRFE